MNRLARQTYNHKNPSPPDNRTPLCSARIAEAQSTEYRGACHGNGCSMRGAVRAAIAALYNAPSNTNKERPHIRDLALAYKALPAAVFPPTGTKPVRPKALRAAFVASAHFFNGLLAKFFLELADLALETTLPRLFFVSLS